MNSSATIARIATIGTALGALLLAGVAHAWVTVEPSEAPPAGTVTVTGSHFRPDSPVEVFLKWKRCSVTADANGQFACTFKVPKSLEPGARNIWTANRANGRWVRTPFMVQPLSTRIDWGNEAFDAGRTRYNPYENVLNQTNVGRLKRVWTAPGLLQLVVDGRVIVAPTSLDGVRALNEVDGTEAWSDTGSPSPVGYAAARGRVYLMTALPTRPNSEIFRLTLRALSTSGGDELWTVARPETVASLSGVLAVSQDLPDSVYFGVVRSDGNDQETSVGALAVADGRELWQYQPGWAPVGFRGVELVVTRANAFVSFRFSYRGIFQWLNAALEVGSGTVLMEERGYGNDSNNEEYVPLPVFELANSRLAVQRASPGWNDSQVFGARLIVSSSEDGTTLWSWPAGLNDQIGKAALTQDTVFVGIATPVESRLYAFKALTGEVLWSRVIAGNATIQPTVANGVVYLGNRAYDARNGDLLWTNPELVDTVSPIVVNGRLYANQIDGNVSAWGLD